MLLLNPVSHHPESLDELQSLVLAEYSAIPNLNRKSPVFDVSPLTQEQLHASLCRPRTVEAI